MFCFGRMLFLGISSYTCQCSLPHLIFLSHLCYHSRTFLQFLFCMMFMCGTVQVLSLCTFAALWLCNYVEGPVPLLHFPPELVWLQHRGGIEGLCSCPWLLPSAGSAASRGSWASGRCHHLPSGSLFTQVLFPGAVEFSSASCPSSHASSTHREFLPPVSVERGTVIWDWCTQWDDSCVGAVGMSVMDRELLIKQDFTLVLWKIDILTVNCLHGGIPVDKFWVDIFAPSCDHS